MRYLLGSLSETSYANSPQQICWKEPAFRSLVLPGRNRVKKKISLPELRKNARVSLCIKYDLLIDEQHYVGETGNISLGGASLKTSTPPLTVDQALKSGQISLSLGQEHLTTNCMVVYVGNSNTPGFSQTGITFKNLPDADRNKLLKFMMQHL